MACAKILYRCKCGDLLGKEPFELKGRKKERQYVKERLYKVAEKRSLKERWAAEV